VILWIAEADTMVTQYRDLAVVGDQIWVLSQSAPFLQRYSTQGHRLGASLPSGDGPHEVRLPNWIIPSPGGGGDGVAAYVVHRMRELVLLDSEGRPTDRRIPFAHGGGAAMLFLEALSYGEAQLIRAGPPGQFIVQHQKRSVVQAPPDIGDALLLLADTSGVILDTLLDLSAMMTELPSDQIRTFIPIPLWAMCGDETLVTFSPRTHQLEWRQLVDGQLTSVAVPPDPRPITLADRRRFVRAAILNEAEGQPGAARQLLASLGSLVTQMGPSFASTTPPAVGLLCEFDGTAWLQEFATETDPRGFGRSWRSFTPAGPGLRLLMPGDFRPRVAEGGRFTGWLTGEDGVQRVARVSASGR
jgi:hypothetical protein